MKRITFKIPSGEVLKLSSVSGATAYIDAAATVPVAYPLVIQDETSIYFSDALTRHNKVFVTVTDDVGNVLLRDGVKPANRSVGEERVLVELTSQQRFTVNRGLSDSRYAREGRITLLGNVLPASRAFEGLHPDPPVIGVGSHNGGTSVSSPVHHVIRTSPTKVRCDGTPRLSYDGSNYLSNWVYNELAPWSMRYITDTDYHEVVYQASSAPAFRLWVDGRRVTEKITSLTSGGGGLYRLGIRFRDRRLRRIRLQCVSLFPSTITVSATDSLFADERPPVIAAFIGDSYTQQYVPDNWAGTVARLLGWEPMLNGSGGTGYLATNGSHLAFASRLPNIIAAAPDVIVFAGGINDSAAGLQAAATACFSSVRAALPKTRIYAIGPWAPSTGSAVSQAAKGAAISAACAATGARYIDNLTDPWITGSGKVTALAGDGNADLYVSSDGVHVNADGSYYIGTRVANAIHADLLAG